MEPSELEEALQIRCAGLQYVGRRIRWVGSTASTNDLCHQEAVDVKNAELVVLAERQTAGRGQYGRRWEAPSGKGLLASIVTPAVPELQRPFFVAWAAAAVADVLRRDFRLPAVLRWPNDVLCNGRKIAGVLVEIRRRAVVGVGLNVNQNEADFPPDARTPPTSLLLQTRTEADRVEVAAKLLFRLDELFKLALAEGETAVQEIWASFAEDFGDQPVRAVARRTVVVGRLLSHRPDQGARIASTAGGVVRIPAEELLRIERA